MRGSWGVLIRVHGEIFGNLYLAEKRGGEPFDDHDVDLVRVLATEAGIVIGNARLYEAAKQRERWIRRVDRRHDRAVVRRGRGRRGAGRRRAGPQAVRLSRRDRAAARRRGRPGDRRRGP